MAEARERERMEEVFKILRKQMQFTVKQEKFCTDACVARFLKCNRNNVKKAAKQLKSCLRWRESIGVDHVIADEFCEEISEGVAYVAGHDESGRPVLIFRIRQDYAKARFQRYIRLLVFTLEVAVSSMPKFAEQFVLIFDASFFRSARAFFSLLAGTLKLVSDYYPARLHRAFVLDPPSFFSCLWKGARPFVDLWAATATPINTKDIANSHEESLQTRQASSSSSHLPSSSSFSSSRFSFTVSRSDSLSPWYLSRHDPSESLSPFTPRSFSFSAYPTPSKTPPCLSAANSSSLSSKSIFRPYLSFHRRPYDEFSYRGLMRPPLGGLISVVSPATFAARRRRFRP